MADSSVIVEQGTGVLADKVKESSLMGANHGGAAAPLCASPNVTAHRRERSRATCLRSHALSTRLSKRLGSSV